MRRAPAAPGRGAALLLLLLLCAAPAAAQQLVVDDVAILEPGACQVEAWVGEAASWLHPSCRLLPRTEVLVGIGRVGNGGRATEWMLETKTNLLERQDGSGIAVVAGIEMDPGDGVASSRMAGAWAFVPVTVATADRLLVHLNAGWHYHDHDHGHADERGQHAMTWGLRADVAVTPRFSALGELSSEERVRPAYQVGVRSVVVEDRLALDVTWGGHTARGVGGAGWTLGVAWTPAPWF